MRRIIDKRKKEKFLMDDLYLNGQARICGWQATLVYMSLCRHANKSQESFPSIKLMSEELGVSRPTILKGLERLEMAGVIKIERIRSKNGKWLNNVYILQDKSVWKKIEPIKNQRGSKNLRIKGRFSNQVNDMDTDNRVHKNTPPSPQEYTTESTIRTLRKHIEGNTYKETHNKQSKALQVSGNEINNLIELFKEVNPTYERLFGNKTQRAALERLVKKFGRKQVEGMIKGLKKIFGQPYAPTITTPYLLEKRLADYVSYLKKRSQEKINFIDISKL